MDSSTRSLVDRLVDVLYDRMTDAGHPKIQNEHEHLGVCSVKGDALRCRTYRALFVQATRWLDEHPEPTQATMFDSEAAG